MTPKQVAWIKLICLAVGTGCAAGATAYATGSKVWGAAIVGLGTAATNVYHALAASPNDSTKTPEQN